MYSYFRNIVSMFIEAAKAWNADDPFRHGATIAYYAIFSMPGLLMIIIWIAGSMFGQEAAQGQVSNYMQSIVGSSGAERVEQILVSAEINADNIALKSLGIVTLVLGATTLFLQLQKSFNEMWEVKAAPKNGILKLISDRATSLGLILAIAFLLLITLLISTALSIAAAWLEAYLGEGMVIVARLINGSFSICVSTLLFAIMLKVLPDVEIGWRSVWVGAITTAILFTLGKTLLGIYFRYAEPASSFGAAGTVILIMLWVNYTCLILFFGVKFSQTYTKRKGYPITPSEHAEWTAEHIVETRLSTSIDELAEETR